MTHEDTTIVFVPGAWHSPDGFDVVIGHLQRAGYNISKVYLPSVLADGAIPIQTFDADVAEIRKQLAKAVNSGQKVVMVMHSYGGHPASQAIEGFDQASMVAEGHIDGRGVVHLVYLASFMVRAGESPLTVMSEPADWVDLREDTTSVPKNPALMLYHDFESSAEVDIWVARLRPFSQFVALSTLSYEPWRKISTTYLLCDMDKAVPSKYQREMVRNAIDAGAIDMRMVIWNCGHTPFGVKPLETSQLIRAAVGDIENLPSVTKSSVNETITAVQDDLLVPVS